MTVGVTFVLLLTLVVVASSRVTRYADRPFWLLAGCIGVFSLLSWVAFRYPLDEFLLVSVVLGATVGVAEVVSRYRDEPFVALLGNAYGPIYIGLNGLASTAAYGVLFHFGDRIIVGVGTDPVLRSLAAGFGASLLLRSKFFNLRSAAGEEIGVGPDAVISTLLRCVDRGIDRARSARRQRIVYRTCGAIAPADVPRATSFLRTAIASFQNLSDSEKREFDEIVARLANDRGDPLLRFMLISFAFLNISGEENFETLMDDLGDFLRSAATVPLAVLQPPGSADAVPPPETADPPG